MDSSQRICSVDGCARPLVAKGLCRGHYYRARAGKTLDGPIKASRGAITPDELNTIRERYEAGDRVNDIAADLGI